MYKTIERAFYWKERIIWYDVQIQDLDVRAKR